jgi:NodT family efflux transporter outer membrane factor (OMF) lipoprotein
MVVISMRHSSMNDCFILNRTTIAIIVAVAMTVLMAGCAVGPDFHRPPAPDVKGYSPQPLAKQTATAETFGGQAQQFVEGQDIPAQWWNLFHSESLNRLVEHALKANPSLDAAQAALRQAQENVYAAEGTLFPSVNANVSGVRQKNSGAQFGNPNNPGSLFTLYNASIKISYGIDVFGLARRTLESIEAQAEFQRYQMEAAYLTLTSNVVTTAVQEASLRGKIASIQEIIKIETEQLDVLQQQFDAGAIAKTNVLAQQVILAQTQANLPPLEKQLALIRNQLTSLAGNFPSQDIGVTFDLASLQLPQELPVSLPSQLVEQRPDIRAAEAQLHQASALIGVATANMFPQFTLNGSIGSVATQAGDLLSSGTGVWSLGADLAQPLFRGGTLTHQRRAALDAYDQAAAQYRSTVLSAFQNVADALRALQSDADALRAESLAAQAASDSLDIARDQYKNGAISYLSLLNAQQAYQQTQDSLIQAQANRYADTAALFQALGGGWWHRDEATGTTALEQIPTGDKQ